MMGDVIAVVTRLGAEAQCLMTDEVAAVGGH